MKTVTQRTQGTTEFREARPADCMATCESVVSLFNHGLHELHGWRLHCLKVIRDIRAIRGWFAWFGKKRFVRKWMSGVLTASLSSVVLSVLWGQKKQKSKKRGQGDVCLFQVFIVWFSN